MIVLIGAAFHQQEYIEAAAAVKRTPSKQASPALPTLSLHPPTVLPASIINLGSCCCYTLLGLKGCAVGWLVCSAGTGEAQHPMAALPLCSDGGGVASPAGAGGGG